MLAESTYDRPLPPDCGFRPIVNAWIGLVNTGIGMVSTNLAGRAHGVACRLERGGRKRATLDGTQAVRLHKRRRDGDGATVHAQDARDSSTEAGTRAQPPGGGRERGAR